MHTEEINLILTAVNLSVLIDVPFVNQQRNYSAVIRLTCEYVDCMLHRMQS
jgi:hypothetical protein